MQSYKWKQRSSQVSLLKCSCFLFQLTFHCSCNSVYICNKLFTHVPVKLFLPIICISLELDTSLSKCSIMAFCFFCLLLIYQKHFMNSDYCMILVCSPDIFIKISYTFPPKSFCFKFSKIRFPSQKNSQNFRKRVNIII